MSSTEQQQIQQLIRDTWLWMEWAQRLIQMVNRGRTAEVERCCAGFGDQFDRLWDRHQRLDGLVRGRSARVQLRNSQELLASVGRQASVRLSGAADEPRLGLERITATCVPRTTESRPVDHQP